MSNRALAVAVALQTEMPELSVVTAQYTRETNKVSCADSPVVVVSDGLMQGFTVSVYGDDGDDIAGLARDVFRATQNGFDIGDAAMPTELSLSFTRTEPMLDDSDYLVGERMHFVTIEHCPVAAAA